MKKLVFFFIVHLIFNISLISQNAIGKGNISSMGVTIIDQYQDTLWTKVTNGANINNREGLNSKIMEASRFLTQATLGFENYHIDEVLDVGIGGWIDVQMQLTQTKIFPKTKEIYKIRLDSMAAHGAKPERLEFRPRWKIFNYAWWDQMMRNEDLLRHRVALAFTEIFVISRKGDLQFYGDGFASYYDMLAKNTFGNYKDLLRDITLHPCMGKYLSHLNNQKTDTIKNIHPDENYAREIMQLFSIGLYELNIDGSRKLDGETFIPTYGQEDIQEFAKIFTGLSVAGNIKNPYNHKKIYFGKSLWTSNINIPMIMYEDMHEQGEKKLLGGKIVPSGQTGMQDIEDAIDNLFNHPNVGPFIAFRIIQRMVKSNPSPEYVARVAAVFNDNGNGVRGDMGATIKAILMDEEARTISSSDLESSNLLKEPLLRYTQFARFANKKNTDNYWWNDNENFAKKVKQDIFDSPSVFNFYLPDYSPNGDIAEARLFAPEFTIHTTITSPSYVNEVYKWTISPGELMQTSEGEWMEETSVKWDITSLKNLAVDSDTFINELDMMLTHGTLSEYTRAEIYNVLTQIVPSEEYDYLEQRVRIGTYLFLISPDYAIMK
jgi:uncharacterized protein (DUF1800 family)